jgi:ketopantoate hydroxymethyltransferase
LIDLYTKVDIIRLDLNETAFLYNYKDAERISEVDIFSITRNIGLKQGFLAIDVPLNTIYQNGSDNPTGLINFYQKSNADILVINHSYNPLELIKKINTVNIPVIINSVNRQNERDIELDKVIHSFKDYEDYGVLCIILENYTARVVNELKNQLEIPLAADIHCKVNGYYAKFSTVFALSKTEKQDNIYLNLYQMIDQGIKDCLLNSN